MERLNGGADYVDLCEDLWRSWVDRPEELATEWGSVARRLRLSLTHCPEPYLVHEPGDRPLVFLTTNPGEGMPMQTREAIPLRRHASRYSEVSRVLGQLYSSTKPECLEVATGWKDVQPVAKVARTRIDKMRRFADLLRSAGADVEGVVQVEVLPFHSASLPNKGKTLVLMQECPAFSRYISALRSYLVDRNVLAISGVGTDANGRLLLEGWPTFLTGLLGLTTPPAPTLLSEGTACWVMAASSRGAVKATHLMQGGNALPKDLERLVDAVVATLVL